MQGGDLNTLYAMKTEWLKGVLAGNAFWQIMISIAILAVGFVILETFWRYANRHVKTFFQDRDLEKVLPYFSGLFPSLRLAIAVLLIRMAEIPLNLPEQLGILLHGLEAFLLALAVMFLFFHLVGMLDLVRFAIPDIMQRETAQRNLARLKSVMRIIAIFLITVAFLYTQQAFFPEWLWRSSWWRYLLIVLIMFVLFMGGRVIGVFFSTMVSALRDDEERVRLRLVLEASLTPIYILLAAIVLYAVREILIVPPGAEHVLTVAVNVLGVLFVVFFAYRLLNVIEYELMKYAERDDNRLDQNIVRLIRMVARVLVIVFGIIYLLQAITGKPMNTLLAGLGIGGLAVALAAQDTLKNLFGSFMIMIDKPFIVGERVIVEGYDGVVEEIGFRSTRIRTFPGHLIAIPNEKMASANVENIHERPSIRRLTNITITYDTPPAKVEKAISIIKNILQNHEGMHSDYPPRVYFNEFNDTSLNITMIYWYFPPDYWEFMAFGERINLEIMKAFEAEGIEFAFPTTTTYLAQDDRRPLTINISGDTRKGMGEFS